MARRLVSVDRKTPLLLPPAIQEWVAPDDMARFVVEAVEMVEDHLCSYNWRGSGSRQYPPRMLMALLIHCYANGVFSSRRIERATYRDVAVRYITGDTHPDHDTIATFRRKNQPVFKACFVKVLELARQMKLRRVGEVAIDGSKLEANASKKRVLSKQRIQEEITSLQQQVSTLIEKASQADRADAQAETDRLPDELCQTEKRLQAMRQAMTTLEEKTAQRSARREQERESFDRQGPGEPPRPLPDKPADKDTLNLTDPDARLLPQKKGGYAPGYNVQIAVQADVTVPLILATGVCDESNDRRQLEPMVESTLAVQPDTSQVLVDTGYDNSAQIYKIEQTRQVLVCCPPEPSKREPGTARQSAARTRTAGFRTGMKACMRSESGRRSQTLRATTVEPVFGWLKNTLGFRRFHLRGLTKVQLEWELVCLAHNIQLLHRHSHGKTA